MKVPIRLFWHEPTTASDTSAEDPVSNTKEAVIDLKGDPPLKDWNELKQKARSVFGLVDSMQIDFYMEDGNALNQASFPEFFEMNQCDEILVYIVDPVRIKSTENSIESVRSAQQHKTEVDNGGHENYKGKIDIKFHHRRRVIEIRDNGTGMSSRGLRQAMAIGAQPIRGDGSTAQLGAEKAWQVGNFGNFGIGLKCSFKFGENGKKMELRINTKQETAEFMSTTIMDYEQMLAKDEYFCIVQAQVANKDLFGFGRCGLGKHGTQILLSNVDEMFWSSCGKTTTGSKWDLNDNFMQELSEKYFFYFNGMDMLRDALRGGQLHIGQDSGGGASGSGNCTLPFPAQDTYGVIDIVVNGQSLDTVERNCVLERLKSMRLPSDAAGDGPGSSGHGSAADGGGAAPAAADEGAGERWRPCWHGKFRVCTKQEGVKRFAEAHIVLFYIASTGGAEDSCDDADSSGTESERQLLVFWQELFFKQETLGGGKVSLPFMAAAKKAAKGSLKKAFDRVRGFLFLDDSFKPNPNKTILAPGCVVRYEMLGPQDNETKTEYKRMQTEITQRVQYWHHNYDRLVLFSGENSQVTLQDGEKVIRWQTLEKTFGQSGVEKVQLGAQRISRLSNPIMTRNSSADGQKCANMVKYSAAWPPGRGDYIIFQNPASRSFHITGQLKCLQTSQEDGLNPNRGKAIVALPFLPDMTLDVDNIVAKKPNAQQWRQHVEEIKSKLPHSLKIEVHGVRSSLVFVDADGYDSPDMPFRMTTDILERFQVKITLLDQARKPVVDGGLNGALLPNKKAVLDIMLLVVKFELFDAQGGPVLDEKGNPWSENELPKDRRAGPVYCSAMADGQNGEACLNKLLKLGTFKLKASIEYTAQRGDVTLNDEMRKFLAENRAGLEKELYLDVIPGRPHNLLAKMENYIWMEDPTVASFTITDARKNEVPAKVFSPPVITWQIIGQPRNHSAKQLKLLGDNYPFRTAGIVVPGFKLPDSEQSEEVELVFKARFDWSLKATLHTPQLPEKGLELQATVKVRLMTGLPATIAIENSPFHRHLTRHDPLRCQLRILDAKGNVFIGLQDQMTIDVGVEGEADQLIVEPARRLVNGIIELPDQLKCRICCPYGVTNALKFVCDVKDQRPPATGGDGESARARAVLPRRIERLEQFQVEKAVLEFELPAGLRQAVSYDTEMIILNIDGQAAMLLEQVKLKTVNEVGGVVKELKPSRDRAVRLQRLQYPASTAGEVFNSIALDRSQPLQETHVLLAGGSSPALGSALSTKESFVYVAEFDGLRSQLAVNIRAGIPSRVDILQDQTNSHIEIGKPWDLYFRVYDASGVALENTSHFRLNLMPHSDLELRFAPEAPALDRTPEAYFHARAELKGRVPPGSEALQIQVEVSLVHVPATGSCKDSGESRPNSAEGDSGRSVAQLFSATISAGRASKLKFVSAEGADLSSEQRPPHPYVSGQELNFGVEAVDDHGNRDRSFAAPISVTFVPADGDQTRAHTKQVTLASGYVALSELQWEADLLAAPALINAGGNCVVRAAVMAPSNKSRRRHAADRTGAGGGGERGIDVEEATCLLAVRPGGWQARIEVRGGDGWNGGGFVIDDNKDEIERIQVRVLAQNGTAHTGSRVELKIQGQRWESEMYDAGAGVGAGAGAGRDSSIGIYEFVKCVVPREAGEYDMHFQVLNPEGPPCSGTCKIQRLPGRPETLHLAGPSDVVFLKHGSSTHVQIRASVKNRLGMDISARSLLDLGYTINFDLESGEATSLHLSCLDLGNLSFRLTVQEKPGMKQAVSDAIIAVVRSVQGGQGTQVVKSQEQIAFHYEPESTSLQRCEELKEIKAQLKTKERQKREIDAEIRNFEDQSKQIATERANLQKRENRLPALVEIDIKINLCRDELQQAAGRQGYTPVDFSPGRGGPGGRAAVPLPSGLDIFRRDMAGRALPTAFRDEVVGIVGELGRVAQNRGGGRGGQDEAQFYAEGIGALAGNKLMAVAVKSERCEKEIDRIPRYKGLTILVLAPPPRNVTVDPGDSDGSQATGSRRGLGGRGGGGGSAAGVGGSGSRGQVRFPRPPPPGACYAVNKIVLAPELEYLRLQMWYHVLHDDLIFESMEAMDAYKEAHGRTHQMAARRPQEKTWRVIPRGQFSRAGAEAPILVLMSCVVDAKETEAYKGKQAELTDLERKRSERLKLDQELLDNKAKEALLHRPPQKRIKQLQALEQEIKELWTQLSPAQHNSASGDRSALSTAPPLGWGVGSASGSSSRGDGDPGESAPKRRRTGT